MDNNLIFVCIKRGTKVLQQFPWIHVIGRRRHKSASGGGKEASKGSVYLHLTQNVFKVICCLLNWVSVNSFVSSHHYPFVFRQALDLFLHIAPLMRAPVVTPAHLFNRFMYCTTHSYNYVTCRTNRFFSFDHVTNHWHRFMFNTCFDIK